MRRLLLGVALGGLVVLLLSFAFRERDRKSAHTSTKQDLPSGPQARTSWSSDVRPETPRLREEPRASAPAEGGDTPASRGVDPYEVNPIGQVASAGLDRETELDGMLDAMEKSGVASGEWVARADARIDEVHKYLKERDLGTATELGCWNAGCGIQVTFNDAKAARHPDLLTNPYKTGRWTNGVVITEPRRLKDGDTQYAGWIFFLGPLEE